jgi:hypothetical protein
MAYSKGTGTPFNGNVKTNRTNDAKVAAGRPIPSTGGPMRMVLGVARKPGKNKAAK